jgi:hypothetical protein
MVNTSREYSLIILSKTRENMLCKEKIRVSEDDFSKTF